MEQKERIFNFSAPCTYIEHQEIRVEAGGSLYFGRDLAVEDADAPAAATTTEMQQPTREPAALFTPKAMQLWEKLQAKGLVDEDFQPVGNKTKAAIIADEIAQKLGLEPRWKPFEALWGLTNLRQASYDGAGTTKGGVTRCEVRNALK